MDRAAVLELFLQALQIFEEEIDGAWPGKQDPGVRHDKMCASRRGRAILVQNFLVLAFAIQIARNQLEHIGIASGVERSGRPVLLSCQLCEGTSLHLDGSRNLAR